MISSYYVRCRRASLLFLTFSVLVANPKKLLYTVAIAARGLLNRRKITKQQSLAVHLRCSYGENILVINKNTARVQQTEQKEQMAKRASRDVSTCCLGAIQVSVCRAPVKGSFGSSTRSFDVASQVLRIGVG